MSIDRKIINRIEQDHVRIIPRWFFAAKEISAWLAAGALLAISSLALAMTTLLAGMAERPLFDAPLAYGWLAVFVGFFVWGYRKLRQAGFSYLYKLSFMFIIPIVLLANMALGYAFYEGGQAERVERKLEKIPVYQKLLPAENRPSQDKSEPLEQGRGTSKKAAEASKKSDSAPEAPAPRDEEAGQDQSEVKEIELPKLRSDDPREAERESGKVEEEANDDVAPAVKAKKIEEVNPTAKEKDVKDSEDSQEEIDIDNNEASKQMSVMEDNYDDDTKEMDSPSVDD
ncbi:MAG: hypothetical protein WC823_06370 [Parcubacteria group bacterium]|jgi:hypothetical protein